MSPDLESEPEFNFGFSPNAIIKPEEVLGDNGNENVRVMEPELHFGATSQDFDSAAIQKLVDFLSATNRSEGEMMKRDRDFSNLIADRKLDYYKYAGILIFVIRKCRPDGTPYLSSNQADRALIRVIDDMLKFSGPEACAELLDVILTASMPDGETSRAMAYARLKKAELENK